MLDTVTLITFLAMGILLCFYGFRLFRFSMALAGFFMGMQGANLMDSLFLLSKIPEKSQKMWEFFFPIVLGVVLAVLSYALYKKALFFITVFFTWYSLVKICLLQKWASSLHQSTTVWASFRVPTKLTAQATAQFKTQTQQCATWFTMPPNTA